MEDILNPGWCDSFPQIGGMELLQEIGQATAKCTVSFHMPRRPALHSFVFS
jgi:hypothetical protein